MVDAKIHRFTHDVSGIELPSQFTYPMHYVPHALCRTAAAEVMDYALSRDEWREELRAGKMLGVLVVNDAEGEIGYLAAYSGNLAHSGEHDFFVPHIYNLLDPEGMFRTEEAVISEINRRIELLEQSAERREAEMLLADVKATQAREESAMRNSLEAAKQERDKRRGDGVLSPAEEESLIKESQFMKAEYRRMKKRHRQEKELLEKRVVDHEKEIGNLKSIRKAKSEELQRKLFRCYVVNNARGESLDVATIFERRLNRLPPGGTGECCAPKLLQYAYRHGLKPVCMAEFWVGESPQGEVRHHGHYYPACRSKCLPLLEFMLQGLDVESNPLAAVPSSEAVQVVYNDEWLIVVDKPAGMLTVPGRDEEALSLLELVRKRLDDERVVEVHRLDQATSGLVVFAKTREVQSGLRLQFENREVSKTYLALLDGIPEEEEGTIELPLRANLDDRPRQVVDFEHGKDAVTRYRVLEYRGDTALVEFTPLTGRTHQLRVHASHPQGLNCPIVGDMLYGTAAQRLCLHAKSLCLTHPVTGKALSFTSTRGFKISL